MKLKVIIHLALLPFIMEAQSLSEALSISDVTVHSYPTINYQYSFQYSDTSFVQKGFFVNGQGFFYKKTDSMEVFIDDTYSVVINNLTNEIEVYAASTSFYLYQSRIYKTTEIINYGDPAPNNINEMSMYNLSIGENGIDSLVINYNTKDSLASKFIFYLLPKEDNSKIEVTIAKGEKKNSKYELSDFVERKDGKFVPARKYKKYKLINN
jgi:hypothetical protein